MVRTGLEQKKQKTPGGKILPNSYLEAPVAASTLGQVHDARTKFHGFHDLQLGFERFSTVRNSWQGFPMSNIWVFHTEVD